MGRGFELPVEREKILEREMGFLSLKIPDDMAADIEQLAAGSGETVEQKAETLLRWSLRNFPQRESLAATARRISAMTPKGVHQIPAETLLREDRSR